MESHNALGDKCALLQVSIFHETSDHCDLENEVKVKLHIFLETTWHEDTFDVSCFTSALKTAAQQSVEVYIGYNGENDLSSKSQRSYPKNKKTVLDIVLRYPL